MCGLPENVVAVHGRASVPRERRGWPQPGVGRSTGRDVVSWLVWAAITLSGCGDNTAAPACVTPAMPAHTMGAATCVLDAPGADVDAPPMCVQPATQCGGDCVDTQTNPQHCGACNAICPEVCAEGRCVARCPLGQQSCGGACVDLKTNASHCGACNRACSAGITCSGGACQCGPTVRYGTDIQPIFNRQCTSCHAGSQPRAGLDLTASKSYAELVNGPSGTCGSSRKLVTPSNVPASYLINKLRGAGMCFGGIMPPGTPLPESDIAKLSRWICQGAPRN